MELQLIQSKIHTLRGQRVMLDFDLAALYEVPNKAFKQAVRRNIDRFPPDFMFELSLEEFKHLRSQIVTSNVGGTRYLPYAFTEQGIAMLSGVLNSKHANHTNIAIMRAFVAMRHFALSFAELAEKVLAHDKELGDIVEVLRWLGEENQARYNEIQALQEQDELPADWAERVRIGFRKDG